jgi:hypothetical protein
MYNCARCNKQITPITKLFCDRCEELRSLVVHCKQDTYDVYIGRPSQWGNQFTYKENTIAKFKVDTREESISKYEEWLLNQPELIKLAKKELYGKVLGCFCRPNSCHGDILIKVIYGE